MSKGEATREAVLHEALSQSSKLGLQGISIGRLADATGLSKSGLFGHFRSKEQLQVDLLNHAARRFRRAVVDPALEVPAGEERLRTLFRRWLGWDGRADYALPGGCIFITASYEFDDEPDGPVRDRVVELQQRWLDYLATTFREGVEVGELRRDVDAVQLAYDFYGIMLACHVGTRLLKDDRAASRAEDAFERLLDSVRAGAHDERRDPHSRS